MMVQSLGCATKYNEDVNFREGVRMLVSFAFLPPCDVEAGLDIVRNKLNSTEIIDYFQITYIRGDVLREIKSTGKIIYTESMFKIDYWSVWDRLETDMDRTKKFPTCIELNCR